MKRIVFIIALLIAIAQPIYGDTVDNVRFIIEDVSPNVVEPGYRGPLNITVRNVGVREGYRVNAEMLVNTSTPVNLVSETKKYLDFRDAECDDPLICNILDTGNTATFTWDVSVDDDATTGVYILPLKMIWTFSLTERESTLNFGVEVVGAPELIISGVSTDPSVVYPDTEFDMPIIVENIGTDTAKSVELTLTLTEGLSGKTGAFMGTIAKDATATATFNLKAEKGISLDHHNIPATLRYIDTGGEEHITSIPLDIFIQDRGDAKLSISGVNTTPSKVYPNTDFILTVALENTGSQAAKATKLVLNLSKEFTGEDSAFLGTIQKDELSSASFDMRALKTSPPGIYTVNTETTFTDEQGRERSSEEAFNLFILERGEIVMEISGKSTSPTKLVPGTEFTLSLQLENIGEQDAKSVRVDLDPNSDFNGEFTSFVGEIEQDDVSTGVFDLSVSPTAQAGTRTVTASVIYIDERGIENTVVKSFDLFVGEKNGHSRTSIIIGAVVVISLAVYLWRRRKSEYTET